MSTSPNPKPDARSSMPARPSDLCPLCSGTGWKPEGNGVIRCHHSQSLSSRAEAATAAGVAGPAGSVLPAHEIPIGAAELRRRVDSWLRAGRGPTNEPLGAEEKALLELLLPHLGQAQAVSLDYLARQLEHRAPSTEHRISDRFLKQLVHDLRVTHGVKVGSLRGWKRQPRALGGKLSSEGPRGYFLCLTAQDVLATVGTRLHEALATLEVLDALTDGRAGLKRLVSEARGQFRLFERSTS